MSQMSSIRVLECAMHCPTCRSSGTRQKTAVPLSFTLEIMPSDANIKLKKRLKEIDEVISAHDAICPANAGKPALQKGAAVIKAGTTLLVIKSKGQTR